MPVAKITHAMILAAGRGTRMKHLTDARPKPLIPVAGKPLIDHVLDKAVHAGVREYTVNLCYLGEKIKEHLLKKSGLNFHFSEEENALETGGGVKKALPFLGGGSFFVLNADPLWTEPGRPALERLKEAWNPETMDALLLLQPMTRAFGHDGIGDYFIRDDGTPRRKESPGMPAPYVFAGAQILNPRLFREAPDGKFPLIRLYDQAEKEGRLACVVHDGDWFHVGTPEATALAEEKLGGCH